MIDTLPTAESTAGTPLSLFSLAVQLGDCSLPWLPITFEKHVVLNILNGTELRGNGEGGKRRTCLKTTCNKINTGA